MDPDTLYGITGRHPKMFTGYVRGFMKITVPWAPYPWLVEGIGLTMSGLIWEGVDAQSIKRMTKYEGKDYATKEVLAQLVGRRQEMVCQLFVPLGIFTAGWSLEQYQKENVA